LDTTQDAVRSALGRGHVIDITTKGRRSGRPRRIEIVFHNIDGHIYISGTPNPSRTRAWLRNLEADPHMTLHLKGAVRADLPATARVVTDPDERKRVFDWIVGHAWRSMNVDAMQRWSPLIEVEPEGLAA
jgi:deazaflavin-dependent oxidoreductase (nitroreductase family)